MNYRDDGWRDADPERGSLALSEIIGWWLIGALFAIGLGFAAGQLLMGS